MSEKYSFRAEDLDKTPKRPLRLMEVLQPFVRSDGVEISFRLYHKGPNGDSGVSVQAGDMTTIYYDNQTLGVNTRNLLSKIAELREAFATAEEISIDHLPVEPYPQD